jgi:hypothetical protein
MKQFWVIMLCLSMLLYGCAKPVETTPPTTEPVIQTSPEATPPETTIAPETTLPVEETTPAGTEPTEGFSSYTVSIADPEKRIYEGPAFCYPVATLVGEAGVYTIVEETLDTDLNLWGRLKSGLGWICLTEPPIVQVSADYAPDHFVAAHSWHCGEAEYVTHIGILPNEPITNVVVSRLGITPAYVEEEILWTVESLSADEAAKISVVFWGDMTTYGIRFLDMHGNPRYFALSVSGRDGSLVCTEYLPLEGK